MMAARTPSPFNSPPLSPLSPRSTAPRYPEIIYESYLHKTPPLEKLFVSWRKRYFVLSRNDPMDPSTLELAYYMDSSKKQKRGVVNLSKFLGLSPNAKVGNKEHAFALETEDRKYIFRAPDAATKNVWLAKLCEFCGQEQVYHVMLPHQSTLAQSQAILKLADRCRVLIISPTSGSRLMDIPYTHIRRMGNMDAYNTDIIWFETCSKAHTPDQFLFFVVPSGFQTTQMILRELKMAVECATGVLLITEETNGLELSFISRSHYGCHEFPLTTRNKTLQSGIKLFSYPSVIFPDDRRGSEPARLQRFFESSPNLSLEDFSHKQQRKMTVANIHPLMVSHRQQSGLPLDQIRKTNGSYSSSHLSGSQSGSGDLSDSGILGDVFDSSSSSPLPVGYSSAEYVSQRVGIYGNIVDHTPSTHPAPLVPPRSRISLEHAIKN